MYFSIPVKLRWSTLLTMPGFLTRHGCHAISMQIPLSAISVRCWSLCCYCHGFVLQVDKLVEHSTTQAIRQWRRLPPVISQQHIPLLQVGWTECFVFPALYTAVFPALLLIVVAVMFRQRSKSWNSRKQLRFIRDFSLRMSGDRPACMTWKLLWKRGGEDFLPVSFLKI